VGLLLVRDVVDLRVLAEVPQLSWGQLLDDDVLSLACRRRYDHEVVVFIVRLLVIDKLSIFIRLLALERLQVILLELCREVRLRQLLPGLSR